MPFARHSSRLIAAGRDVGERSVAGDDEVRSRARPATPSLNGTLSATVDLIGEQIVGLGPADENASTKIPRCDSPDDARQRQLCQPSDTSRFVGVNFGSGGYVASVGPELKGLWLLRHGQSLGNVANDASRVVPVDRLDIAERDMDVPLSDLGVEQAQSFGAWLSEQSAEASPDVVVSSPYVRAVDTARYVVDRAGLDIEIARDERLREREFGILDLLTHQGIVAQYPSEAARRKHLGKFYYRPPGGESWVDVALRLRSLRDSLVREYADRRVLVVTHEVPIIITRYLLERFDEGTALELSRSGQLANCSLTTYVRDGDGPLRLDREAWTAPLEREQTPVTEESDAPVAPR